MREMDGKREESKSEEDKASRGRREEGRWMQKWGRGSFLNIEANSAIEDFM